MSSASTPTLRILLVEDETVNRALLRAVLRSELGARLGPLELVEASTLAAAREALRAHAPDVIILDVRLPDGDGLDLARALAGEATNRPAVLVMSASVLPADRDAARRAGGDAFLGKPFKPVDLVVMLAELAAGRRNGARE
jgi:two-component system KDP operon response regulator KdpE